MLDIGLTKLALIGVVALVVVGPERLPRVARTLGALVGRAQRYVNDVKAEVSREMEIDSLREMRNEFAAAAQNVERTIHSGMRKHEAELNDAWAQATSIQPHGEATPAGALPRDGNLNDADRRFPAGGTRLRSKRVNWRIKQAALPAWYKRTSLKRTRVQSGAARVARHTPASMRRRTDFF